MQFKISSIVTLLALSAPLKVIANSIASPRVISNSKDVTNTAASPPKGRTLGLALPIVGGVLNLLFGSGGYSNNGGYVKPCGGCGGTQYYGNRNGYYGIYSRSQNIKYINNYNGTYTLYIYGLYGGSSGGILAVTCPSNSFKFTPYNQGYYCQINQSSQCYSRII